MRDETRVWLTYADENFEIAKLALAHGYVNSCLHNVQQSIEKALKAVVVEHGLEFRRTHSVRELTKLLANAGFFVNVSDEECDLIDSIFVPSKYPAYGVLPDSPPDQGICERCIEISTRIRTSLDSILE